MDNTLLYNQIISSYQDTVRAKLNEYSSLVEAAMNSVTAIREVNKKTSELYNPLFYFTITEPINSRILADLLNPKCIHGQGDLFLSEYLKDIQVEYKVGDTWKVERESENADIVLTAKSPFRVVVIENKVNNANDQPNQLFRYYRLKIEDFYSQTKNHPERYKIVYLTKSREKYFSAQSIMSADGKERVPEKLILRQSFKDDIKRILENCLFRLDKENYRLKAFLHFLIEQTTS